jgi:hypothetical protein
MTHEQLALELELPAPDPVACEHCGEEFLPNHPNRRYCTTACTQAASERRVAERDSECRRLAGTQISHPCRCIERGLLLTDWSEPTCVKCGRRANVVDMIRALRDRHRRARPR